MMKCVSAHQVLLLPSLQPTLGHNIIFSWKCDAPLQKEGRKLKNMAKEKELRTAMPRVKAFRLGTFPK